MQRLVGVHETEGGEGKTAGVVSGTKNIKKILLMQA